MFSPDQLKSIESLQKTAEKLCQESGNLGWKIVYTSFAQAAKDIIMRSQRAPDETAVNTQKPLLQ